MRRRLCARCLPFVLAASLAAAAPGWSQTCTWGGTPTMPPPAVTPLWADQDQLRSPSRLAADEAGNVYVADPSAGRVFVRDAWGRLLSVKQGLAQPLAIAVDVFGIIYVGEAGTGSVSAFGQGWDRRIKFGRGDGEFAMPNHIAIDPDPSFPRLYVVDSGANVVKVYSTAGSFLFQFGEKGVEPGQFDFPAGIHVSRAGEVFVADQNNDRVQVFDRGGKFLRCFGGSSTQRFGRIQGVTGDVAGRVYVADAFQGYVWAFEPGGVPLGRVGSFGEGPGELLGPGGIVVDPTNRLLVASAGSSRVAAYGLDSFKDPHAVHAVAAFVLPNRGPLVRWRVAFIEIPGHALDQVRLDSIAANGVRAQLPRFGDRDGDGVPDITVQLAGAALLATFPADAWAAGEGFVGVTGEFFDGTPFEATGIVDLQRETPVDWTGRRQPGAPRATSREQLR